MSETNSIWRSSLSSKTALLIVLLLTMVFGAMRVLGVLGPSYLRPLLPLGFCLMAAMPWMLLKPEGRRQIGLTQASGFYLPALAMGAAAALICFGVGILLFGSTRDNWFVTIGNSYRSIMDTSHFSIAMLHAVFTVPALIFSPIGEEIFFRGLLQRTLEEHFDIQASTILECAAFGLVHLCHHGLLRTAAGIVLLPASGALWVALMFLTALLFARIRKRTGSIYPSMASHAAFNLTMNIVIFSTLWQHSP